MKKMIYFAAAALSMVSMAACSGNKCGGNGKCAPAIPDEVYAGILPVADADGMSYTLRLDYDDDKGNKAGDYDLTEQVLVSDSTNFLGLTPSATFLSEGDFTVVEKDGNKYLKLVKDVKNSNAAASGTLTFLVASDSTLVMVNDVTMETPTDVAAYTLKMVK